MTKIRAYIIYKIKRNVELKGVIKLILMFVQFPVVFSAFFCALFCKKCRRVWIIGETGIDAKDNGLAFFSYLRKNHPEINAIYYIEGDSNAEKVVKSVGPTVRYNSFKHKMMFMSAKYVLSTHDGYSIPFKGVNWREFKILYGWLVPKMKFVFLNHGVNKDDTALNANYKRTCFDYTVTTTIDEYNEMSSKRYGYPEGSIVMTGLARYDVLQNAATRVQRKKEIVFMPTWRYYLADVSDDEFMKSDFFKNVNSFLNHSRLNDILTKNGLHLYFFPPHHEIQDRIHLFSLNSKNVSALNTEKVNFSNVILNSSMMITDYSSVIFDFAYLYKRTAYFQFDLKAYRSGQYKEGYFKYSRDGFGPICTNVEDLVNEIERAIQSNFELENQYKERIDRTFSRHDNKNCERLFNILIDEY